MDGRRPSSKPLKVGLGCTERYVGNGVLDKWEGSGGTAGVGSFLAEGNTGESLLAFGEVIGPDLVIDLIEDAMEEAVCGRRAGFVGDRRD